MPSHALAQAIQLSLAPVFLLASMSGLLMVLTNRLTRLILKRRIGGHARHELTPGERTGKGDHARSRYPHHADRPAAARGGNGGNRARVHHLRTRAVRPGCLSRPSSRPWGGPSSSTDCSIICREFIFL